MLSQYQSVKLVRPVSDSFFAAPVELKPGQKGVIVEIYTPPGLPTGYHVEFFDDEHNTVGLAIVEEADIEPIELPKPSSHQEVL
jgi:hypothetical protein